MAVGRPPRFTWTAVVWLVIVFLPPTTSEMTPCGPFECNPPRTNKLRLPNTEDCTTYYQCTGNILRHRMCELGEKFDKNLFRCRAETVAVCQTVCPVTAGYEKEEVLPGSTGARDTWTDQSTTSIAVQLSEENATPPCSSVECLLRRPKGFRFADPNNCFKYYECLEHVLWRFTCPTGQSFDKNLFQCRPSSVSICHTDDCPVKGGFEQTVEESTPSADSTYFPSLIPQTTPADATLSPPTPQTTPTDTTSSPPIPQTTPADTTSSPPTTQTTPADNTSTKSVTKEVTPIDTTSLRSLTTRSSSGDATASAELSTSAMASAVPTTTPLTTSTITTTDPVVVSLSTTTVTTTTAISAITRTSEGTAAEATSYSTTTNKLGDKDVTPPCMEEVDCFLRDKYQYRLPDPNNCTNYYECDGISLAFLSCPRGELFDPKVFGCRPSADGKCNISGCPVEGGFETTPSYVTTPSSTNQPSVYVDVTLTTSTGSHQVTQSDVTSKSAVTSQEDDSDATAVTSKGTSTNATSAATTSSPQATILTDTASVSIPATDDVTTDPDGRPDGCSGNGGKREQDNPCINDTSVCPTSRLESCWDYNSTCCDFRENFVFPHPEDCSQFYKCSPTGLKLKKCNNGRKVCQNCKANGSCPLMGFIDDDGGGGSTGTETVTPATNTMVTVTSGPGHSAAEDTGTTGVTTTAHRGVAFRPCSEQMSGVVDRRKEEEERCVPQWFIQLLHLTSDMTLAELAAMLVNFTKNPLTHSEINTVDILLGFLGDGMSDDDDGLLNDLVGVVSNLLLSHNNQSWKKLKNENTSISILKTVDLFGRKATYHLQPGEETNIGSANLLLAAFRRAQSTSYEVTIPSKSLLRDSNSTAQEWIHQSLDTISLFTENTPDHSDDPGLAVWGAYYKSMEDVLPRRNMSSLSGLLSISVDDPDQRMIRVRYTIGHEMVDDTNRTLCGFWDLGRGDWSTDGCNITSQDNLSTSCECDHLTNFAIMISPVPTTEGIHYEVLSIISLVGCILNITTLVLTILIYTAKWKLMKSQQSAILLNLCVTLIIANVIFAVGIDRIDNQTVCTIIAILLQFFYLAAFFIMLVEGIELFRHVLFVFQRHRSRETASLITTAWFLALTVVAVSAAVTRLEGYGSEQFCWLSLERGLIWSFIGPVAFVLLVNLIIFFIVLIKVNTSKLRNQNLTQKKSNRIKASAWNILVISPLLGIAWLFGLLVVNEHTWWFQYVFCVCNALQGLFILIVHGCCNRKRQGDPRSSKSTSHPTSRSRLASEIASSYLTGTTHSSRQNSQELNAPPLTNSKAEPGRDVEEISLDPSGRTKSILKRSEPDGTSSGYGSQKSNTRKQSSEDGQEVTNLTDDDKGDVSPVVLMDGRLPLGLPGYQLRSSDGVMVFGHETGSTRDKPNVKQINRLSDVFDMDATGF